MELRLKRKGKGIAHYAFKLLKFPLRLYLKWKLRIHIVRNEAKKDKGPYLVVGNHVTNYDPLIILAYTKPLIRFVAASNNYDHWLKRFFFRVARVIAINKKTQDVRTIRQILAEVKQGSSIGVFPEGGRNWDGTTDEIIYSTAKLIKFLKLPVYNQKLIGGYLTTPRWCKSTRKGRLDVEIYQIFSVEETKSLSDKEIYERLVKELQVNDYEYQRERLIPYKGKDLAEYIERLIYACPNCQAINTFYSKGNHFYCKKCESAGKINVYGFIEGDFPFDNLVEFNRYQKKALMTYYKKHPFTSIFIQDVPYRRYSIEGLKRDTIDLTIKHDGITIKQSSETINLSWEDLSSPSLTFHNTLTVFEQDTRHQFIIEPFLHQTSIVYLYETIRYLRGENHDGLE